MSTTQLESLRVNPAPGADVRRAKPAADGADRRTTRPAELLEPQWLAAIESATD